MLHFGTDRACALTIVPTFDASVTGDPNALTLEADFNTAIAVYQSLYTDNITVSILFRYATTAPNGSALSSGTLARSNYVIYSQNYATYINALTNDSKSANDATAVAHLPTAATVPTTPTKIDVSSANGRAVGLNTQGTMDATSGVGTGSFDGIVTVNSSQPFQLTRTGGISGTKYDIEQSIEHEIDEVLGLGSVLPNSTDFTGNVAVKPEDLFRYSAAGTLSLTTSGSATSYLSIDGGTTNLASFNQNSTGDYGDWGASAQPLVQLAFSFKGTQSDVSATSPEGVALDVVGYDLAPEPTALTLLAAGMAFIGCRRRRSGNGVAGAID